MSPSEVYAVMRGRQQQQWQTQGRPSRTAAPKRSARPGGVNPTAGVKPKLKCVNCSKEGHRAQDCRAPKREVGKRPCFNCGEEGHLARDCKKPPAKPAMGVDTNNMKPTYALMMASDGTVDPLPARGRILPPRHCSNITLADFIVQH